MTAPPTESIIMGTIQREEFDGIVSLFIQPLSGGELLSMMRIRADVHPPQDHRSTPKIEIFFHGSAYVGKVVACRSAMLAPGGQR